MSPNTFFFTHVRLSIIFGAFGFLFLFIATEISKATQMVWMNIGMSIAFFILSLYFIMKEKNKDIEQITNV
jgi:phosphoglycerol transferase MdoB-like AlkP superfamily enzyme